MRGPSLLRAALALAIAAACAPVLAASISVVDDAKHTVTLPAPAKRIISLAPHATELLFAAGAGSQVVAVTDYSDYPAAARSLPRVGSATALDLERIISLKPDLVVGWGTSSGQLRPQIEKLRALGIAIYDSEPTGFESIASSLERLGRLAGRDEGLRAAADFRQRWKTLSDTYAGRAPVTVFYQVWKDPLMTLNDSHLVSAVIRLCGGKNIFGSLAQVAPTVNVEGVVQADPEVILAGSSPDDPKHDWHRFPGLTAVARGNVYSLNSDWLARSGPRVLDGAQQMCGVLEEARAKRPK